MPSIWEQTAAGERRLPAERGFSQERGGRIPVLESGSAAQAGANPRQRVCYFTAEKLVGCRNELTTLATIGPFFSVSARA
jgi:hypothetical protein